MPACACARQFLADRGSTHDLYVGQLRRSQPKTIGTILLRQPGNILI